MRVFSDNVENAANQLGSDQVVPDCIPDKFRIALNAKRLHDPVLVKGHGSGPHVQDGAYFFHHISFGNQLQHFALPFGQPFSLFHQFGSLPSQGIESVSREGRRKIHFAPQYIPHGGHQLRGGTGLEQVADAPRRNPSAAT
jgi:hypothetical protein